MSVRRIHWLGIALGLAVTAGSAGLFLRFDGLERRALDQRFLYANRLQADPRIVHVDIDDSSIEKIGRWPWPRDVLADLVRGLHGLGARTIAVDLLLDTRQDRRTNVPQPNPDEDETKDVLGELNEQNIVFPDLELVDAIRRAGNVYLSTHFQLRPSGHAQTNIDVALDLVSQEPHATVRQLATRLGLATADAAPLLLTARIVHRLLDRFDRDETGLASDLGVDAIEITRVIAGAKREAAGRLATRVMTENPRAGYTDLFKRVLPHSDPRTISADAADLKSAYDAQRSLRALQMRSPTCGDATRDALPIAVDLIAPLNRLVDASHRVGFVVFERDGDGRVREMPVAAAYEGRLLLQLGVCVACDILGVPADAIRLTGDGYFELPRQGGLALRIPVDAGARMIIPWTRSGSRWRTGADFRHVPAAAVLAMMSDEHLIRENQKRIDLAMADLISATKKEFAATYVDHCIERSRLERSRHLDQLYDRSGSEKGRRDDARIAALNHEISEAQSGAESMVEATIGQIQGVKPESDDEARMFAAYRKANETLGGRIARLRAANAGLASRIALRRSELQGLIDGKFTFVGYTATAEGDIVPTAIDSGMPGVIAHSNVLNAILAGYFIEKPQRSTEVVLILLVGTAITLLTVTRGPIVTVLATLGAIVAYTALNFYLLFLGLHQWVALAAPIGAMVFPWAVVTVFRQLTAERQKRFVQSQLAEFTDPSLARRIADDPAAAEALQRVENREVTCFFSDLAGFTTIAEQHDSRQVQSILNTYLDRMSEVLFQHEAFVNKFLGDGIMAFFNPNVNPQPHHARLACESALESFAALDALKREMKDVEPLYEELHARIGLASGIAGVGRFGSRRKADYTVIGDVANLAARLEPANKVFGTKLLVSGPTREAVKDLFEWRYLAELQVKGKKSTVPVYELISRRGEMPEGQTEFIERFETGVRLYRERKWDECIVQFTRLLARRVLDAGASAYIDACQEKKIFPPGDDWNGALELKEK